MTLLEKIFSELTIGLTRKMDFELFGAVLYFYKGDKCLFEFHIEENVLWCDLNAVWNRLKCDDKCSDAKIRLFVRRKLTNFTIIKRLKFDWMITGMSGIGEPFFKNSDKSFFRHEIN